MQVAEWQTGDLRDSASASAQAKTGVLSVTNGSPRLAGRVTLAIFPNRRWRLWSASMDVGAGKAAITCIFTGPSAPPRLGFQADAVSSEDGDGNLWLVLLGSQPCRDNFFLSISGLASSLSPPRIIVLFSICITQHSARQLLHGCAQTLSDSAIGTWKLGPTLLQRIRNPSDSFPVSRAIPPCQIRTKHSTIQHSRRCSSSISAVHSLQATSNYPRAVRSLNCPNTFSRPIERLHNVLLEPCSGSQPPRRWQQQPKCCRRQPSPAAHCIVD